jgi:molecular chaperone HscB
MDITQNYFELLRLPQEYFCDKNVLSQHYRELQKQFHPDNYVNQSATEQRLAVQFAAYINTAHQTLMSPVRRAEYMLVLRGEEIDHQSTTISDGQFLMLQMEWRESLMDIGALNDAAMAEQQLDELTAIVSAEATLLENTFNQYYCENNLSAAKQVVAKLYFVEKMLQEIERLDASLFD